VTKRTDPWFKWFPRDYRAGTRSLSPAARGVYMDVLCLIYEVDGPLTGDDKWFSHQLHISTRLWRKLRDELVAAGKLTYDERGISNERALAEIESRAKYAQDRLETHSNRSRTAHEPRSNRSRTKLENSEKPSKNKERAAENGLYARASSDTDTDIREESPKPPGGASGHPALQARDTGNPDITFENGVVTLVNGERNFWLQEMGGDEQRLKLALIEVGSSVQWNSGRPVAAQVARQLARIARDTRDRDTRYQSTVRANAKPSGKPARLDQSSPEAQMVAVNIWEGAIRR
jgi:uncharacterized protein YdaU (DUF1376 family)